MVFVELNYGVCSECGADTGVKTIKAIVNSLNIASGIDKKEQFKISEHCSHCKPELFKGEK